MKTRRASVESIEFVNTEMVVSLSDGKVFNVSLIFSKSLLDATDEELQEWEVIGDSEGIRWPKLDEDISLKPFFNREINVRIATEVVGEPEPPEVEFYDQWCDKLRFKETKEKLETSRLGGATIFPPMYQLSPGGNWHIIMRYENGDRPEWEPNNFVGSLEYAQRAFETYYEGEPQLLMEFFRSHTTGQLQWMAYADMRYGYGEIPSEAICDLLLILLDDPYPREEDDPEDWTPGITLGEWNPNKLSGHPDTAMNPDGYPVEEMGG